MSLREWFRAGLGGGTIGHVPGTKPFPTVPPLRAPLPEPTRIYTFPAHATPKEMQAARDWLLLGRRDGYADGYHEGIRRAADLLRRLAQDECAAQVETLGTEERESE